MKLLQILTFPTGLFLLGTAIMLQKMLPVSDSLDFFIGLLFGLSAVLNVFFIIIIVSYKIAKSAGVNRQH